MKKNTQDKREKVRARVPSSTRAGGILFKDKKKYTRKRKHRVKANEST
jgi:hypothetical protein